MKLQRKELVKLKTREQKLTNPENRKNIFKTNQQTTPELRALGVRDKAKDQTFISSVCQEEKKKNMGPKKKCLEK